MKVFRAMKRVGAWLWLALFVSVTGFVNVVANDASFLPYTGVALGCVGVQLLKDILEELRKR